MMTRLFAAALILCLSAVTAMAGGRAPTAEELQSLQRDVAAFNAATEDNDAADIIDALPTRVIPTFAEASNMTGKDIRATLVQNARAFGAQAKPRDMAADLTGLTLTDVKTRKDGTLSWGLIKLTGSAMSGQKRVAFSTTALALKEKTGWHFARIDAAGQASLIRMAYPELKDLPEPR